MTPEQIAAQIDPRAAQMAVLRVMAALGSQSDWNADTLDNVAYAVHPFAGVAGTPSFTDQDDTAVEFWDSLPL